MSNNSQENTTLHGGSNLGNATKEYSPSAFLITIQVLISSFNFFGNLLIIQVIITLKNSKLRKATKVSICYVSAAHSLLGVLIVGRLFKLPCPIFLLGTLCSGFNALNGMGFLAYETFILMKRPYDHKMFVSMRICMIQIFVCNLVTLSLNVAGYIDMRKPDDPSFCYFTSGVFSPIFVLIMYCMLGGMIVTSASFQICTVRQMKKVNPVQNEITVSFSNDINPTVTVPVVSQSAVTGTTPLHRLARILSTSLPCFVLCLSPTVIANITFSICELLEIEINVGTERTVLASLSSLVLVNGILHAVIYIVMSTQIRDGAKQLFKSCLCK